MHLEGRSRLLVFETDSDETLVLAPGGRRPFAEQDANNPRTGPITIGERMRDAVEQTIRIRIVLNPSNSSV